MLRGFESLCPHVDVKFVEAGQGTQSLSNWGKFGVGVFTPAEWAQRSNNPDGEALQGTLLRGVCGWGPNVAWVLDLQTGEGALFNVPGFAPADVNKHRIWVCPMYEPFLAWLHQHVRDHGAGWWEQLPSWVDLPDAPFSFHGYRRPGVASAG